MSAKRGRTSRTAGRHAGPGNERPHGDTRRAQDTLTEEQRAAIRAAVRAMPPATDAEIQQWCDVIANARHRRGARRSES